MAEREIVIDVKDYPSNSNKSKEKAKLEKVTTGKIVKREKGIGAKLSETFLEDDARSVGSYIFWDILIPSAKNLIADMVTKSIDMFFWGGDSRSDNRTYRERNRSYVNYGSYSDHRPKRDRDRYSYSAADRKPRSARMTFDDIIFDNRQEAENVLSIMIDHLDQYDEVTVADFYDLIGFDSTYTDRDWGWDNLGSSYVDRVRNGYIIRFPRVIGLT